jgi:hypothetical protein
MPADDSRRAGIRKAFEWVRHSLPGTHNLSSDRCQGQGAPTDFGLSADERRAGTIYVEVYPEARADGEQPAQTWCIVIDEGGGRTSSAGGTVPQQWEPPR